MNKRVYISADYDEGSGDRNVVEELNNLKSATIIQYTIKGRFMSR